MNADVQYSLRRASTLLGLLAMLRLLFPPLWAQDPYYSTLTTANGLPHNDVYDLFQDSRGFIWVATDHGLSRFDGHSFAQYWSSEVTSLSGSNIFEDPLGRIWYQNFDGNLQYVQDDSLHVFRHGPVQAFVRACQMGDILMVPTLSGLEIYDIHTLRLLRTRTLKGICLKMRRGEQRAFLQISNLDLASNYWLAFDARGNLADSMPAQALAQISAEAFDHGGVTYLAALRDDSETMQPVTQPSPWTLIPFAEGNHSVRILEVIGDQLWRAGQKGLHIHSLPGLQPLPQGHILRDKSVSAVLRDSEGNHWVGTLGDGLLFIPDMGSLYFPSAVPYTRMAISGSSAFVGTQDGRVLRWEEGSNTPTLLHQNAEGRAIEALEVLPAPNLLVVGEPTLSFIDLDAPGSAPICYTLAMKSVSMASPQYAVVSAPQGPYLMRLPGVQRPLPDPWDSRFHLDEENRSFSPLLPGRSRAVLCREGDCLMGTANGLFRYSPDTLHEITTSKGPLLVMRLVASGQQVYALSTLGQLFALQPGDSATRVRGLPPLGPITGILADQGLLYVRGAEHLYELAVSGDSVLSSRILSSPNLRRVNDMAIWQGKLALTTQDGLVVIDRERVQPSQAPTLLLTRLLVGGRRFPVDAPVEVGHQQNEVRLDYSVISYRSGGSHPLWYRLNDGPWTLSDPAVRSLRFPSLAPGRHHIQFALGAPKASPDAEVRIRIRSPFWLQTWFILACALAIMAVVIALLQRRYSFLRRRQLQEQQRLALEQDLRQSKLIALRAQMNPHFIFNALNTIQSFIFTDDKKNAGSYLTRFSRLTRTVLEMSEREEVSLAEEMEALRLYLELEQARFETPFHFSFHLGEGIQPAEVFIPSLILQPYCENAVKHGLLHKKGDKTLLVSFTLQEGSLLVRVEDNGIGRNRSAEINAQRRDKHISFASAATQKRVDLLSRGQAHISVEVIDLHSPQGAPEGTCVRITLPLHSRKSQGS